jgi:transcriptional antiterminator RfaH
MNARLPNDTIPTRWYVVKSKPRAEREAAEQLTRQDYRVVLPELIQPRKRWEALFPSYLAPVRSTLGVSQLVRFGTTHATVPDQVVQDALAIARWMSQRDEAVVHGLTAGTPVMMVEGPLKGLQGLVTASAQDRVFVLLEIMGREVTVQAQARVLRTM